MQGARVAAGPVDCVKSADYILSILDSGPVVREVFFDSGAADAMKRGAVFIDMASIPPKMAQEQNAVIPQVPKFLGLDLEVLQFGVIQVPEPAHPLVTSIDALRTLDHSLEDRVPFHPWVDRGEP